jgi:hypothetical protein
LLLKEQRYRMFLSTAKYVIKAFVNEVFDKKEIVYY